MPKKLKKYKIKRKDEDEIKEIEETKKSGYFSYRQKRERSPEEKREYLKLGLFLLTWVIFLSGIYMLCIKLEFEPVMPIYLGLGIILFFVWLIFNGGFKKPNLENYEKPEEMGYDEFTALINKLKERQRKAKYFLVLFIPFPMIMLVDLTIMVWGDKFLS